MNNGLLLPGSSPKRKMSRLTIGVLIKDAIGMQENQWRGVHDAAEKLDVNLITFAGGVLDSPRSFEGMPNVLYDLVNPGNVDGLIIWSAGLNWYLSKEKLEAFCRRFAPLPVLSVEVEIPGLPCLITDDYQGMRKVMEHLIKTHGYRRIAFIRGSDNHAGAQERYRAYVETLRDCGLPYDPRLVSPVNRTWDGAGMMTCLLDEQHADFEAVVAASDYMMLYALWVLRERGVRVPEDVAAAAFDNLPQGKTFVPPLTTVDPSFIDMGRRAVELMLIWLQSGKIPEREIIPGQVIVRHSCGCWSQGLAQAVVPEISLPQQWLQQLKSANSDVLRRRAVAALTAALDETVAAVLPPDWAARVWEAFHAEVRDKDARTWAPVLNDLMDRTETAGVDMQIWEVAISAMRRAVRPALTGRSLARAENLWQQGRVLVNELALGMQGRLQFHIEKRSSDLNNVSQMFNMTLNIPQLMDIVARELPLVGIRSCYLALYERSTEHTGSARLMMAYSEDGRVELEPEGRLFPAPDLLPVELWPAQQRFDLMVKDLYFQKEQIGFVLFDTGTREGSTYDVLSGQIGSALKETLLFSERGFAEEVLRQRLAELEALHNISAALRMTQMRDEALPILLDKTLAVLETDSGAILLHHPENNELRFAVARGWMRKISEFAIKPGEEIAGKVFATGEAYVSTEFGIDQLISTNLRPEIPAGWGGACVPICFGAISVGVLFVSMPVTRPITPEQTTLLNSLAELAGATLHRMSLHEETVRRLDQLAALHSIDMAIAGSVELRMILNILLEKVVTQLNVDAAGILLLNPITLRLEYSAGRGFQSRVYERSSLRMGEDHAGRAAMERCLAHIPNLSENGSAFPRTALLAGENFVEYFAVPLIAKGEVKGVLEVFHHVPLVAGQDWVNFLETLAEQAAIAIDSTQLFENLQRANLELGVAYDATIEGLSRALDLRDKETEGHTLRVTERTLRLALAIGVGEAELVHIRRGGLLHDIGKMGIPDAILLKPGPLTDEEWVIMRRHPVYAYELLAPIAYLHPALDIPYCHHEKWDGTGYPRGLHGEQIPLAARIFATVDVWDALRSDRPYRKGWPEEKVIEYIKNGSGTHFDPTAVELFLRVVNE